MLRTLTVALAMLALGAAPAAAAPPVPPNWLGMAADGPMTDPAADQEREWDLLAASGVRSARIAFNWRAGQPAGPGAVDFASYDRLVLTAAGRGLRVLPVVLGAPAWAAAEPGVDASPPRDPADYGRFLQALVGRYGPRGSLWTEHPGVPRRPIRDWQIWNEPDYPGFWSQQPFAAAYVRVLRESRRALRAADPGARAILGGLTGESWRNLRSIYRAGGRGHFDAVALHPYTARPANVVRIVRYARRVMRNHGDRRKPVWVTEMSFPAAKGRFETGPGTDTTDRIQARRLRNALERLAAARRRLRIERVFWYTWLSIEGTSGSVFNYAGLRRVRDGRIVSAPALKVFRRTARRLRR